jgi:hypothetical protein
MAARLKVFSWSDGFHAFTVAASSRAKALEAWGSDQDLFKTGLAREDPDSPDAEAARAAPGEVIKRGLAVDVGEAKPQKPRKPDAAAQKAKARLKALEADLEALDTRQSDEQAAMAERQKALDAEAAQLAAAHAKDRKALLEKITAARSKT